MLEKDGEQKTVRPEGPLIANSSEALLVAAVKGAGIALTPDWMAAPHLKLGSSVEVLPGLAQRARHRGLHAVMPPGALVPAKTRVFVDEISQALAPPRSGGNR